MTGMLATVIAFAIINYALKSVGPVLLMDRRAPDRVDVVIEALPPALLTGMLVSSIAGARWSALDPAMLAGLCAAAVAWSLRAPQLVAVEAALLVTIVGRWLW